MLGLGSDGRQLIFLGLLKSGIRGDSFTLLQRTEPNWLHVDERFTAAVGCIDEAHEGAPHGAASPQRSRGRTF